MPTIDEIRISDKVSLNSKYVMTFSTVITEGSSGSEQRFSRWSRHRKKFVFSREMNLADMQDLRDFHAARLGSAYGFRFKDWSDYSVTDEPLVNDGSSATLQLIKTYGDSEREYSSKITKPIAPITMKKNGSSFTAFTLDDTTGIVTLNAGAQAGTFTWTGEFDIPVRFVKDEIDFVCLSPDMWDCDSVELIEIIDGD